MLAYETTEILRSLLMGRSYSKSESMYNKHSFYVVKLKMRDVFLLDILSKEQRIEQCLRYCGKITYFQV